MALSTKNQSINILTYNSWKDHHQGLIISHLRVNIFYCFRGDDERRPDLRKVGLLTCIFEISVYLVLTDTATVNLENVLNYNNPDSVWSN